MPEIDTPSVLDHEPPQQEEDRSNYTRRDVFRLGAVSLAAVAGVLNGEANAQQKQPAKKPLAKEQLEAKLRESIEQDFNNPKRFVEMPMNEVMKGTTGDALHAKLRPRAKKGDPSSPSSHYQGIDVIGGQQTMIWDMWRAIHEVNGKRLPVDFKLLRDFVFELHFSNTKTPQPPHFDVDYQILKLKMQEYFSARYLKKYADYHATLKPEFGLQGVSTVIPCNSSLERAIRESCIMRHDDKPHMKVAMHNVLDYVSKHLDLDERKKVPYTMSIVDTAKRPSAIVHVRSVPLKKEKEEDGPAGGRQPIRLFSNVLPDGRALCVTYPDVERVEELTMFFFSAKDKLKEGVEIKDAMKVFKKLRAESQEEMMRAYGDLPVYTAEFDPNGKKKVTVTQQKPGEVAGLEPKR